MLSDTLSQNQAKRPISEANLYGILYCLLQLLNLSEEWKNRVVDPRNPILPHVYFLHELASTWYMLNLIVLALNH